MADTPEGWLEPAELESAQIAEQPPLAGLDLTAQGSGVFADAEMRRAMLAALSGTATPEQVERLKRHLGESK